MNAHRLDFLRRLALSALWVATFLSIAAAQSCSPATLGNGEKLSAEDQVGCTGASVDCGGVCVATSSNAQNCGGCGIACGSGELCLEGACSTYCASGELDCDGTCLVALSDPLNCGGCGVQCAAGEFCDNGQCSSDCSGVLCAVSGGASECAHLDNNNDRCGSCETACGDGQACVGGICQASCPAGRALCDGVCIDVRSDSANCGSCGAKCEDGVTCTEGACGGGEPTCVGDECGCSAPQTECNDACVDVQASPFHCGSCGNECASGKECVTGACQCLEGTEACGDVCADVAADNQNCGACGVQCSGGTSCVEGSCECPGTLSLCDETCVDLPTDPSNCGGCGVQCAGHEMCVEGICKYDGDSCGGEARSVRIDRVAIYQAVEQDLFDGSAVATGARKVDVIQQRDALVRVFVTPEEGFSARELSSRVFVDNGGEIAVYHHKRSVSSGSQQNSLDSTFQIDVPAEAIQAESKYWVELVECGPLPQTSVGSVVRFPATAPEMAALDARQTGTIKVVFVPVSHDGRTPDTSAATVEAYAKEVEKLYPTVRVEASVRSSSITSNQSGTSVNLGNILDRVTGQRETDGVAGDVYYYGLIDPAASFRDYCQGGCTTGVGWVPGATGRWADANRAAVGIGFGTSGVGTFSHELGHNHGRNHAPCGGAGGPDPSFPYGNGGVGEWGYDRDEKELKDPSNHKDFMGYCDPSWVSDYTFRELADRIAILNGVALSQQDIAGVQATTSWERMLVTDAGATWSHPMSGPGAPSQNPEMGIVVDEHGELVAEVEVHRMVMSHTGGYILFVPPSQPGWHAVGAVDGPLLAY